MSDLVSEKIEDSEIEKTDDMAINRMKNSK